MFTRIRRRRRTETTATCFESMEQKVLLSGMSVADAKATLARAESELTDAQQNLQQTKQQAELDVNGKKQAARKETKEAKQAGKRAEKAAEKTQSQLDKAAQKRADQKEARANVKGPAIFSFRTGRGKKNSEKTNEKLKEERAQAQRLRKLMEKNAGDNPTARQEQYMHGQQAKIHEINAELNRRKAKDARENANEEKQEAEAARKAKREAQQNRSNKIAAAQAEVTEARSDVAEAKQCLKNAEADAKATEINAKESEAAELQGEIEGLDDQIEAIREEWKQTIDDIWQAVYFARQLGLTDDSFDAGDLEAWKDQMKVLSDWVGIAGDADMLPPGLSEILEGGTEVLPLIIDFARDQRLQQMEWEMQGIDLGNSRGFMEYETAREWMAADKHGDNAVTDPKQAKRVMRIIVGWAKSGSLDTAGLLGSFQHRIDTVSQERNDARQQLTAVTECLTELRADSVAEKSADFGELDSAFVVLGTEAGWV